FLLIVVSLVVAVGSDPGLVRFSLKGAAEFVETMAPLVLVSLFIERALEVFMTTWRGPEAARLAHEARQASAGVEGAPPTAGVNLVAYRASTQRVAFLSGIALGVIVSALGVRGLEQFVDASTFSLLSPLQRDWFKGADVLLTGAVLGGGADGLHKIVAAFTTFLDTTTKKAQAAAPNP
ncbi:MAG: hypothetical protein Q8S13_00705, partial [Dehalococcoidia bacterium]|nr:hypothetical protein [Dehalococcoidia bacterium]